MSGFRMGIIGHFARSGNRNDGQTVKTNMLYSELRRYFPDDNILIADTYKWKITGLRLLVDTISIMAKCRYVIILLSDNGMRVFFPLLYFLNFFFQKQIHHVVIGGRLHEAIQGNSSWKRYLKAFTANYVETSSMQKKINALGIDNVFVMPNFKRLSVVAETEIKTNFPKPFALCTFSRITREKGIEDAVTAVNKVNALIGETVYTLDLYGPIDENFKEDFQALLDTDPASIRYGGNIPYDNSVSVLRNYFLLLFPTYYKGEGFPGTLIDAFSAGLPVIASDWRYNSEILEDKQEGYIVKTHDVDALALKLLEVLQEPEQVMEMKKKCLHKAWEYHPDRVMKVFLAHMGAL